MESANRTVRAYEELAEWYDEQGLDQLRDRFLVLAADAALSAGAPDQAERVRARLLRHNPQHLLKPYASLAEALKNTDVQNYVSGLRRGYPPDSVDGLLEAMRAAKIGREPEKPKSAGADEEVGTLRMSAARPPARPADGPPVYAVKDEAPARPSAARPRSAPPSPAPSRPAPPPAAPRPVAGPRPANAPPRPARNAASGAPNVYSVLPDSGPSRRGRPREIDEPETYAGAWLAFLLFAILFLAGLALAVLTFAGPFLPPGWLRGG